MSQPNEAVTEGKPRRDSATAWQDWRLKRFPHLMRRRVEEILLVSSAYDAFSLEEDGLLTEAIYTDYADLGLTHAPNVTRVSTGEEALAAVRTQHFDLVITMLRLGDMDVFRFSRELRQVNHELPIVLLIASNWELTRVTEQRHQLDVDGVYVWHGDTKVFLAIIKCLEDRWNAEEDARLADVGVIILVEDSVRFRSSLLPIMYAELVKQTRAVMADGINRMHKLLRMRARPKILVAETYDEGIRLYERFGRHLFGVIADVSFPRGGRQDPHAGIDFIRRVKADAPDTPALLQSSDPANRALAEAIGAQFLHKRSATLLEDVRHFMLNNFGFGDFVFRLPDGREVGRAGDLRTMAHVLAQVPVESLDYHARRNHFSNWLRARTEFALARRLRPRRVSDFRDIESIRRYLMNAFSQALRTNRRGMVEDFSRERFDAASRFARIGGGSLGGKARGLGFVDALLAGTELERDFPGVDVHVPNSVVIGTDVFDEFLDANRLRMVALRTANDEWLTWAFLTAKLPEAVIRDLQVFIDRVRGPIAVRSSSLLEDSQYHPFAGTYATHMIPNAHADHRIRLAQLCDAIKLVYASTFFASARRYLAVTPHRIEEEKMAVVLQPVVGTRHENCFYPSCAGVARSYNFYTFGHMQPEDGVALVALGLGKTVVDGGKSLRFCPTHPQVLPQLSGGKAFLDESQRTFYAVDLREPERGPTVDPDQALVSLELEDAERHGTLAPLASVWSPENQALYDGICRPGLRVVSFAHVLKSDLFPLAAILRRLLQMSQSGMNRPVEMEFAVNLDTQPREFAILQVRPSVRGDDDSEQVDLGNCAAEDILCCSPRALGNGVIRSVRDVVYVRPERFDATRTREIAAEIGTLNDTLLTENCPYVLIGPGRWGSSTPTLGIPVGWGQISAARVIVETTLSNFAVDPSQGSHFFQNLVSFGIAYLTVDPRTERGHVDWDWLAAQPAQQEGTFVRHVRLAEPLETRINGRSSRAVILKRARPGGAT
ncbi:MAG: PEP/pyruvate-binding domain-containing protein [Phycisphaerae bacterium]|jgi:CheY-like chemotaxis protein